MKRPAVFFDRDNTLIVSDGYLGDPSKVVLMEGAPQAIAMARQYGFKVVSISNQSGVARGLFTEADVQAVNGRMDELLQAANPAAIIEDHEACPYHPDAVLEEYRLDSDLRKPRPGMFLVAAEKLSLDLQRSWVIGDAPRDIEAGQAAGCRTILFTPPGVPASPAAAAESAVQPDFTASSLREALEIVAREAFRQITAHTIETTQTVAVSEPTPAATEPAAPQAEVQPAQAAAERAQPAPAQPAPAQPTPVQTAPAEPAHAHPIAAAEPVPAPPAPAPSPAPAQPVHPGAPAAPPVSMARVESLLEQIFLEMKRRQDEAHREFSISKLLAGIVQILAIAAIIIAYFQRDTINASVVSLLYAIALQTLTIALLIMGRQR